MSLVPKALELLRQLYGEAVGVQTHARLRQLIAAAPRVGAKRRLDETDAVLITYPDQFQEGQRKPLASLSSFAREHLKGLVSTIHLLPFHPYSSDAGFSVIDFDQVDPASGSWDDIAVLARDFRLMFDLVVNHVSVLSPWFKGFLADDPAYRDWFFVPQDHADLSRVTRPRTTPLLTSFDTAAGSKRVWTTFSADQVDLNYANPDVLLEMTRILLDFAARGADIIRLDAIAFLWKESGTTCVHLPQTHAIVRLFREVLAEVAPHVLLLTETNVPHTENISYFGTRGEEAQMVYNFALPPLLLHTFRTGDPTALASWAAGLSTPPGTCFFNFIASHDGIGLRAVEETLAPADQQALVELATARGGFVSYRDEDGSSVPYELNINLLDALSSSETDGLAVGRLLAAHSIMFALAGLPAVYVHSLLGSRGDRAAVDAGSGKRSINRERLDPAAISDQLADPSSQRARVFEGLARLLRTRRRLPALSPWAQQEILPTRDAGIITIKRGSGQDSVWCVTNVSDQARTTSVPGEAGSLRDVLTGETHEAAGVPLAPYQFRWLLTAALV